FSSRRRHTRLQGDWSSDVCSSDLASVNCTFSGVVPIALQRFEQSGVSLVECPGCGRAWTLSPSGGVLRFKSHPKRKTNTPNAGRSEERRVGKECRSRWSRED